MRKSTKKKKTGKKSKETENETNESQPSSESTKSTILSQDYLTDKKDEVVDLSSQFENYFIQPKKNDDDSTESVIGVRLTKTEHPFFFIENDIVYDENEIIESSITDVFGHKCDIGQVSFTNLSINGKKITLPTDLVDSFYPNSLISYFENHVFDEK